MTVLSLFDGISCARVALERLGYKNILYLASEVDKYSIQVAQKNYPDTVQLGDIRNIRREDLPVHIDLLIGGSPCQDLSIAKKNRQGLDGERSGLFWEWARLWRECKPKYWVLENVNSMPKAAKQVISETLDVEPIMINAALVSAQKHKRLFWTNIQTDMFGYCHIPQPEDKGILLKHILESGQTIKSEDKSLCISASYKSVGGSQECLKRRYDKSFSQVVYDTCPAGQIVVIPEATMNYIIRKLTPIECERLQSLPDNYTEGISNNQRYKTLGNAFNVEVVRHILSFMDET